MGTHSVHTTPVVRLRSIIESLAKNHVNHGFFRGFSTEEWHSIFTKFFGEKPSGNDDPRWDELFKLGAFKLEDQILSH